MKYESSISSSFPFNKTSVHFISARRLNLNYFDFPWPNFESATSQESGGLCESRHGNRAGPPPSLFCADLPPRGDVGLWRAQWVWAACCVGSLAPSPEQPIGRKRKSTKCPLLLLGFLFVFSSIPQQTFPSEVAFEFTFMSKICLMHTHIMGWRVYPQIQRLKLSPPGPQNMSLYGSRIIADIIN